VLFSLLWYAALTAGVVRVYSATIAARHASVPIEKARHAAAALFACGLTLWAYGILEDAEVKLSTWKSTFDILTWLDLAGVSIWYAMLFVVPTWLPLRLLSGNPGASRCGLAALIARAVAAFAGLAIVFAPAMFLFASSLPEFLGAVMVVAIPMSILIYIALMAGRLASRAGDRLR
jgi:hypothetical protein